MAMTVCPPKAAAIRHAVSNSAETAKLNLTRHAANSGEMELWVPVSEHFLDHGLNPIPSTSLARIGTLHHPIDDYSNLEHKEEVVEVGEAEAEAR